MPAPNTSFDPVDLGICDTNYPPAPLPVRNPTLSVWQTTWVGDGVGDADFGGEGGGEADVVVIGSGITGISAAYHLSQKLKGIKKPDGKNIRVVVLEARSFCSGATGRNGGFLCPISALAYDELAANPSHLSRHLGLSDDTSTSVNGNANVNGHVNGNGPSSSSSSSAPREEVWGNDVGSKTDETIRRILTLETRTAAEILMLVRMEAIKSGLATTDEGRGVDLVSGGNFHLVATEDEEKEFEDSLENAKRAGLGDHARNVKKISGEELDKLLDRPHGLRCAYEIMGSTLHPIKLVALLFRLARRQAEAAGIELDLHLHTPVTSVSPISNPDTGDTLGARVIVETPKGALKARHVLHATNAYVSHLAPQLAGSAGIIPTRAQVAAIQPKKGAGQMWTRGFSSNRGYEYFHQRPASSHTDKGDTDNGQTPPVIFGGGREVAPGNEWGVADDSVVNPVVSEFLHSHLPQTFPQNFTTNPPILQEWTGIMGYTATRDPSVGPLLSGGVSKGEVVRGQWIVAGFSGHGMTRAFSCAEVVAEMIGDEDKGRKWEAPNWFPLCYLTKRPAPL